MSAGTLLHELAEAGVRLSREGDDLIAEILPGASLDPFRDRIREHKPALLKELLQRQIVAAVVVAPEHFDRPAFDELWARWKAHDAAGRST
jgi:hypothetical protein